MFNLQKWLSHPSLKLGHSQGINNYYTILLLSSLAITLGNDGCEGLMAPEEDMLCAKVLRLCFSEVLQYLNAQSILNEMVEKKLIEPQKRREVEVYSSRYAQNISAGVAMFFTMDIPPTFLLSLCDILEGTDCPGQMKLAVKLRSGIC